MTIDDLETRTGLPDALRVLLEAHPRSVWAERAPVGGLTLFWLERHLMFRKILDELQTSAKGVADGHAAPSDYVRKLSRYGSLFVSQLHEHHHLEDMHYFPLLMAAEPRLETGFTVLDGDHKSLDGHLERFVGDANGLLQTLQSDTQEIAAGKAATFAESLVAFERFLDRHLTDEEDIIVPILLEHGEGRFG